VAIGWAAGAGVEIPVAANWTARAEYLSTGFGRKGMIFPVAGEAFQSDLAMQSIRLGLNYHIGDDDAHISIFWPRARPRWRRIVFAFHGQATYVNQYDPPFNTPYKGQNSLAPNIGRETTDVTLYAGMRLWKGAERGSIRKSIRALD